MKKGIFWVVVATFLFSSMEIAIKLTGGVYQPLQLNFLRFLIGGLILLPIGHHQNRHLPKRMPIRAYQFYCLTGFVFAVMSMTVYMISLQFATAATIAILFSCNAFFAIIIAAIFFKQKVSATTIVALIICAVGLTLIINPWKLHDSAIGISLGILAAFLFSVYANLIKYSTRKILYGGLIPTAYTFIFGSIQLLLLILLSHLPAVASFLNHHGMGLFARVPIFAHITWGELPLLIYIAVFVSGVGFAAYAFAIEESSITIASLTFLLKPIVSPIMAYFALGEHQRLLAVIGIFVLAFGSLIIAAENSYRGNKKSLPRYLDVDSWFRPHREA